MLLDDITSSFHNLLNLAPLSTWNFRRTTALHAKTSRTVHYMPKLNAQLHYMPKLDVQLHYMPKLDVQLHYMPKLDAQLHYMPKLDVQLHYMPKLDVQLHYMPRLCLDSSYAPILPFCSREENKSNGPHPWCPKALHLKSFSLGTWVTFDASFLCCQFTSCGSMSFFLITRASNTVTQYANEIIHLCARITMAVLKKIRLFYFCIN